MAHPRIQTMRVSSRLRSHAYSPTLVPARVFRRHTPGRFPLSRRRINRIPSIPAAAIKPHLPADSVEFNQALGAARDGRLEMTRWLLGNGVTDVNAPDGFRRTPLRIATSKGFNDVAEVLRAAGGRE